MDECTPHIGGQWRKALYIVISVELASYIGYQWKIAPYVNDYCRWKINLPLLTGQGTSNPWRNPDSENLI